MGEMLGIRVIVMHPNQLKDLYFLKPCKANDSIMSTAAVWGIIVRHNGNVIPFHKRVYVELNEAGRTARVFRARIGEEPLLLGSLPYDKARRYCASHQQTEKEKAQRQAEQALLQAGGEQT